MRHILLLPNARTTRRPCVVTCPAIWIRLLITVLILRRLIGYLLLGVGLLLSDSCPMSLRMLYASTVNSSTSSFVLNFPDGSLSISISVLISLWYCLHSPWEWYPFMISSSLQPRFVQMVLHSYPVSLKTDHPCQLYVQLLHTRFSW